MATFCSTRGLRALRRWSSSRSSAFVPWLPDPRQERPQRGRCVRAARVHHLLRNSKRSQVAVCRVFTTARRTGRMQRRLADLVIGPESPWTVRRLYRQRFGGETSYRLSGQVRGRTPPRNAAYRFMLWGLSFFMAGVWVHLCWCYTQVLRRGGRWFDRERFRLRRYAAFILQALRERYGYVQQRVASAPPLP